MFKLVEMAFGFRISRCGKDIAHFYHDQGELAKEYLKYLKSKYPVPQHIRVWGLSFQFKEEKDGKLYYARQIDDKIQALIEITEERVREYV